jgi:hypothetical protein
MKSKTTIEVNGKHYDAATGALVSAATAPRQYRGQNIDGFFRSRTTTVSNQHTPPIKDSITVLAAPAPASRPRKQPGRAVNHAQPHQPQDAKTVRVRIKSGVQHSQKLTVHRSLVSPNHTKAVKPQNSQTLMRTAVKRPAPSFHKQAHTKAALQHAVPSILMSKKSVNTLDEARLARAQQAARSPLVSHHASDRPVGVLPQLGPLAVKPVPVKPEGHEPATPPAPQPSNRPTDIFEHALANANHFVDIQTHKAHFRKKARRHAASMAAGTLALLLIAAFAFYQNSPGLQFKVASVHAGVTTHMPDLNAAGFAYNGVKADHDKLIVGFSGAKGSYRLSQVNTNLSGQDVINSLGATDAGGNPDFTTVQADGTTVYRFGNTDALWVQDGTWYTVTGTGALTNDQVTALVRNI